LIISIYTTFIAPLGILGGRPFLLMLLLENPIYPSNTNIPVSIREEAVQRKNNNQELKGKRKTETILITKIQY
jgi:hypothetical protein